MPNHPMVDLVADYSQPGLIVYWLEPNAVGLAVLAARAALEVTNKRLVKPPNWRPQPAFNYEIVYSDACRVILYIAGVGLITFTVVETLGTAGVGAWNDFITIPAGLLLISIATREAQYIETRETEVDT